MLGSFTPTFLFLQDVQLKLKPNGSSNLHPGECHTAESSVGVHTTGYTVYLEKSSEALSFILWQVKFGITRQVFRT